MIFLMFILVFAIWFTLLINKFEPLLNIFISFILSMFTFPILLSIIF